MIKAGFEKTSKQVEELRTDMRNEAIRALRRELDCWHTNARTVIESDEFKDDVIALYQCGSPSLPNLVKCTVINQYFPRNEVRASHIVKRETQGDTMHLYDLEKSKIDDPRNGIPMLEPIELAFDRKQICILYDPATMELRVKVLNPAMLPKPLKAQNGKVYPYTYADVDGKVLQLPPGVFPYRRCLSMHAKLAFSKALQWGWIQDSAVLDTYFSVSDGGLEEPLLLTWQEVHGAIHKAHTTF